MVTIIGEVSQEFYQHFKEEQEMMMHTPERLQKACISKTFVDKKVVRQCLRRLVALMNKKK